tara:strand:- start:2 stop:631 length:630 start_codon:yes stop_codon:yes gene_type:complete
MTYHDLPSRVIAFAAITQAAYLVDKVATTGLCPNIDAFEASLKSIMAIDSASPIDTFGGYASLEVGFKCMIEQLDNPNKQRNLQVTKYAVGMIALEKKLTKNDSAMNLLGERINQVSRQLNHFDISDDSVLANLDSIYKDIISNLGPKIQVNGKPSCLQQVITQHKIRALLLAGVRAAVLWRQLGGKRRQLILSRKAMLQQAKQNLQRI